LNDPLVEKQCKKFENPYDRVYYRWALYGLIIITLLSLLVTILVWDPGYLIAGLMVAALGYIINWYAHDYSKPSQVVVHSNGLILYYRTRKPTRMLWSNVRGIFRRPESDALCKAGIRYYHGRPSEVTLEIADAIEKGYNRVMSEPLKEWDGRRQWGD
jgi:hypothetical protein